jgi:hypothetical protein
VFFLGGSIMKIINRLFHKGIDESKKLSILRYLYKERMLGHKEIDRFGLQFWYEKKWCYKDKDNHAAQAILCYELSVILENYKSVGAITNDGNVVCITDAGVLLYTTNENIRHLKFRTWIALVTAVASILLGILNFGCQCLQQDKKCGYQQEIADKAQ